MPLFKEKRSGTSNSPAEAFILVRCCIIRLPPNVTKPPKRSKQVVFACGSPGSCSYFRRMSQNLHYTARGEGVTAGIYFLIFGRRIIVGTATQFDIDQLVGAYFNDTLPNRRLRVSLFCRYLVTQYGFPVGSWRHPTRSYCLLHPRCS